VSYTTQQHSPRTPDSPLWMVLPPTSPHPAAQPGDLIQHPCGPRDDLHFDLPHAEWLHAHSAKAESLATAFWSGEVEQLTDLPTWRLLQVEPVGTWYPVARQQWPYWHKARTYTATGDVPTWEALGPNGQDVLALYELVTELTQQDAERLAARWHARGQQVWQRAALKRVHAIFEGRRAASETARESASAVVWDMTEGLPEQTRIAATTLVETLTETIVVRDLLEPEHYATLTRPWNRALDIPLPERSLTAISA
jgi:hypothetical protein